MLVSRQPGVLSSQAFGPTQRRPPKARATSKLAELRTPRSSKQSGARSPAKGVRWGETDSVEVGAQNRRYRGKQLGCNPGGT